MNLIKLIVSIQLLLASLCLLIQLYALVSAKWAIFESRVELGLIEEHGHYGLWSICTSRLLAPAEVTEDGNLIDHIVDCEGVSTFFKPAYSRACIAFFALVHAVALLLYTCLLALRLLEILFNESKKANSEGTAESATDLEVNGQSQVKRMLVIATRFLSYRGNSRGGGGAGSSSASAREDAVKRQLRLQLYTISVAAASTALALLSAITPRKPLRESDAFQVNAVSATNYRVWRGPAFWAQLTTLIMDMLQTSLIAIHVRVLFVQQQQHQQITTTCSTSDNETAQHIAQEVIVNPFFRVNSVHSPMLSGATQSGSQRRPAHHHHHHQHHHQHHHSSTSRRHRSAAIPTTNTTSPFSATSPQSADIAETSMSLSNAHHATVPKMLAMSAEEEQWTANSGQLPSTSSVGNNSNSNSNSNNNTNHYVNSKEVRQLKKLMSLSRQQASGSRGTARSVRSDDSPLVATSYCNPLFSELESSSETAPNSSTTTTTTTTSTC